MPRYIDADNLLEQIQWLEVDTPVFHDVWEEICSQPTVDIDAITGTHEKIGYDKGFREGYAQATSEVRHGRWVNHISENGATDGTYCSICDHEVDRDVRYNYCPNCGAKMDESTMGQVKRNEGERREDAETN